MIFAAAGVKTLVGNHSFRGTGITAFLKNGGAIENAAAMANHASTKTTQLYDRRRDDVSLDEVIANLDLVLLLKFSLIPKLRFSLVPQRISI
jgi:integrase